MDTKTHWETIYTAKAPTEVSWFQTQPQMSMQLIERTGIALDAPIIDVGGGASLLADHLLDAGYTNLTVLDISAHALQRARERLSIHAAQVRWLEADVTRTELPHARFGISASHPRHLFRHPDFRLYHVYPL